MGGYFPKEQEYPLEFPRKYGWGKAEPCAHDGTVVGQVFNTGGRLVVGP